MRPAVRLLALLLVGVVAAGCGGGGAAPSEGGGAAARPSTGTATAAASPAPATAAEASELPGTPVEVDPALLEPLTALGPCGAAPEAQADEVVDGLILPEGAVLTSVTRTDPVVSVQGWVPLTPIQFRVAYTGLPELELISIEDEVFEAEVLGTVDGVHRLFLRAQAACESASAFVGVVAPEEAADAVPVPQGG